MVNCLIFSICYFQLHKKITFIKLLLNKEIDDGGNCRLECFLKLQHCQLIWFLFAGFKNMILCSVHSIKFMKYVFPSKISFVTTSTRIVKYESCVVKSNLALIQETLISPSTPSRLALLHKFLIASLW